MAFSRSTRALHWLLALLILGLTALGAWMVRLDYYDTAAAPALHWHRVLGLIALALAALKVGVRLTTTAPPPLPSWRRWERITAAAVHGLLLALMLLTPVSGYLVSTAAGHGIPVAGDWAVPALGSIDAQRRPLVEALHAATAYVMLALVGLHAAAALKHHLIDRDATLVRMLTGRCER